MLSKNNMAPLKLAKKARIHLSLLTEYSGLCNYSLIMIGGTIKYYKGQACYMSLVYNEGPISYFVDHPLLQIKKLKEYEKNYIKWLVNDSVFNEVFYTKDIDEILNYGVIYNVKKSAQFVLCAASSLRYVYEMPHIVKFWDRFFKYMSGDKALIFAHMFREVSKKEYTRGNTGNTNHQWFKSDEFGLNEFKQFVSNKHNKLIPMSKKTNYKGLVSPWKKDNFVELSVPRGKTKQIDTDFSYISMEIFEISNLKRDCKKLLEINHVNE